MSSAFKKIGTAVVTYFAVDKIKEFGLACINAASDAQAMESQFAQVFGEVGEQASESLASISEKAGISENRMKGSFTKIAAFAKTTGLETADALALSERAMIAVADSAAFYDRSLEDTTESLQSFLKGNFENDAALGLSCTETTRNAAANELYGKSFIELSESQKQLTLLKMVEDANALSGAMGQAARESNTWTNQTGNLKQAWTDFTAAIGEKFLPVAIQVVGWIAEKMPEITAHVTSAMDTIGKVISALKPVVEELFNGVKVLWDTVLQPVLTGIIDFISGVFTGDWQKAWDGIGSIVKGVWDGIWLAIKGILNNLIGGIERWINGAISGLNGLISGLNRAVSLAGDLLGLSISIPSISRVNLPRLEEGGILKKGQVGLLEGNGAEAVVPLDKNHAWISAVAADMNTAIGGDNQQTQRIISLMESLVAQAKQTAQDVEKMAAQAKKSAQDMTSSITAMNRQVVGAIESSGNIYMDSMRVGAATTSAQNRRTKMYGKTLQYT